MLKEPSATVFSVERYSTLLHPHTCVHFYRTSDALYDHIYHRKNLKYETADPNVLI